MATFVRCSRLPDVVVRAPQSPYNAPGVNVATVQCKEVSALKVGKFFLGYPYRNSSYHAGNIHKILMVSIMNDESIDQPGSQILHAPIVLCGHFAFSSTCKQPSLSM